MPTYTLTGRITPEHTLEVEIPRDAPIGEASVVVTVESAAMGTPRRGSPAAILELIDEWETEDAPPQGSASALLAWLHEREGRPPSGRSAEEIEAYIQETRNSWD